MNEASEVPVSDKEMAIGLLYWTGVFWLAAAVLSVVVFSIWGLIYLLNSGSYPPTGLLLLVALVSGTVAGLVLLRAAEAQEGADD